MSFIVKIRGETEKVVLRCTEEENAPERELESRSDKSSHP